jgi:sugar lactone lactonase YvrE
MQYRHVQTIDGKGALHGIAVDGHGRGEIYAACVAEIKVFDAAGKLVRRWPTSRPAQSVAVAGDGAVYAGELGQIEIFDGAGKLRDTWRDDKLLRRVTAIGFTGDSVLAGDSADRAIRRFDRRGRFLNDIGKDNPLGGLLIPNGVVDFGVDGQGIVHAANPGKHRVERYAPGGELLGHIGRFDGIDPAGFTGCCNPTNVAIRDAIYTTEKAGPRVKAYDFGGKLLAVIATDLFDANCKNMSIAVDSRGRVYVVDTVKQTILVFERVSA